MSTQSIRSAQESSRLGIAFVTALALHGAVLAGLMLWQSTETDHSPGEQEITIDLAPAMEEVASVAPAEVSAIDAHLIEPKEARAEQPEEVTALPEPQDAAEMAPVEAEMAAETEPVIALPPPEIVVAKPLKEKPAPKPEKKPVQKPAEQKPPRPRTVARPPQPPSEARQGQDSASRENMGGAAASADPNVLNRYVSSLTAALRSRLRYPNIALSQGVSGIAALRFTMDRSGRIISSTLVKSAGHPALDQAALATASPGSSLPPAPAALPQQQFTISVPLRFNLR
jgi:protein TonB